MDLIDEQQKGAVRTLLRKFNPKAEIIETTNSLLDPTKILEPNGFQWKMLKNTRNGLKRLELASMFQRAARIWNPLFTFKFIAYAPGTSADGTG